MNGKMMPYHPGMPHHALAPPHNAYMPAVHTMTAATFAPSLSPNSSVLMTPKSAGTPPSHAQFVGKPPHPFVLHHPTANHTPGQTTLAPYQSHSAPWGAASQNQFIFPSPTAMNPPPPLTSVSCTPSLVGTTHANTIPAAPVVNHWWSELARSLHRYLYLLLEMKDIFNFMYKIPSTSKFSNLYASSWTIDNVFLTSINATKPLLPKKYMLLRPTIVTNTMTQSSKNDKWQNTGECSLSSLLECSILWTFIIIFSFSLWQYFNLYNVIPVSLRSFHFRTVNYRQITNLHFIKSSIPPSLGSHSHVPTTF